MRADGFTIAELDEFLARAKRIADAIGADYKDAPAMLGYIEDGESEEATKALAQTVVEEWPS